MKQALIDPDTSTRWPGLFWCVSCAVVAIAARLEFVVPGLSGSGAPVCRAIEGGCQEPAQRVFHLRRDDVESAPVDVALREPTILDSARTFAAFATERGMAGLAPPANLFHGWALVMQGDTTSGIPIVESTLPDLARGARAPTYIHVLYAEAYGAAGRHADGLRHIENSMRLSDETGERAARAELHRLKGELLMMQARRRSPKPSANFAPR